jgi:hypothetical protein
VQQATSFYKIGQKNAIPRKNNRPALPCFFWVFFGAPLGNFAVELRSCSCSCLKTKAQQPKKTAQKKYVVLAGDAMAYGIMALAVRRTTELRYALPIAYRYWPRNHIWYSGGMFYVAYS